MGIYLVTKNNLKRIFLTKSIYIIIFLLPVIICVLGIIINGLSNRTIRVGIVTDNTAIYQVCENQMNQYENIQYERADASTIHTDLIMSRYQYAINYLDGTDTEDSINKIKQLALSNLEKNSNSISQTERMLSMLMTVYMIIATIYATKIIKDKNDGTFQRFTYSGNNAKKYAMGYFISTGIMILIQAFIAIIIFKLFDKYFSLSLIKAFVIIMAITLFSTVYGVIIALINKKDMNANICASSIAAICSLLGGTFVSIADMPHFLQVLSIVSPIRWIIGLV